jgi:hypothetical protein
MANILCFCPLIKKCMIYNPSTQEAKARGSRVAGQPGLHSKKEKGWGVGGIDLDCPNIF